METNNYQVNALLNEIHYLEFQGERYTDKNIDNHLPERVTKLVEKVSYLMDAWDAACMEPFQLRSTYVPEDDTNAIQVTHTFQLKTMLGPFEFTEVSAYLGEREVRTLNKHNDQNVSPQVFAVELERRHKLNQIEDIANRTLNFLQSTGCSWRELSAYHWKSEFANEVVQIAEMVVYMPEKYLNTPIGITNQAYLEKGAPLIDINYSWHPGTAELRLKDVVISIEQCQPVTVKVEGNEVDWAKDFYRNIHYFQFKNTIRNLRDEQGYSRSIKELTAAIQLQGFTVRLLHHRDEKDGFQQELFHQVENVATDAGATGTHFFSVPAVHYFPDDATMPLSMNFLYNKEAATLDLHSLTATWNNMQEQFIPDQSKIIPKPSIIRSLIEHKASIQKALALLLDNPKQRTLSR